MKNPFNFSQKTAAVIAAYTGIVCALLAALAYFAGKFNKEPFPCHVVRNNAPLTGCYLCGPDGSDLPLCGRGRCSIPASWKGKLVKVMANGTDEELHNFYPEPPPTGVLKVILPDT